jgi:5-methylcytosine-specific restriction endonuclease McrA
MLKSSGRTECVNTLFDLTNINLYKRSSMADENFTLHRASRNTVKQHSEERAAAALAGLTTYSAPRPCKNCATAIRFLRDGKCVECNRLACQRRHQKALLANPERVARIAAKKEKTITRKALAATVRARAEPIRQARQQAIAAGDTTYVGRACPEGHDGRRYTSGGGCVVCSASYASSDAKKQYDKAYGEKNKSAIQRRMRAYSVRTRESRVGQAAEWAKKNPEKSKAIKQSYKHRRRATEKSGITGPELNAWKKSQAKICHWCGVECAKTFAVDHYYPLSKGGKHEVDNLVIACKPCNSRKSAKDPIEFANSIGRLL